MSSTNLVESRRALSGILSLDEYCISLPAAWLQGRRRLSKHDGQSAAPRAISAPSVDRTHTEAGSAHHPAIRRCMAAQVLAPPRCHLCDGRRPFAPTPVLSNGSSQLLPLGLAQSVSGMLSAAEVTEREPLSGPGWITCSRRYRHVASTDPPRPLDPTLDVRPSRLATKHHLGCSVRWGIPTAAHAATMPSYSARR